MSEFLILVVLWLSSSWVFSGMTAPRDAWRPKHIDNAAKLLFAASWVANTIDAFTGSDLKKAISASAMTWFLAIIMVVGIYAITIWVFVKVRVYVYGWKQ